jgi:4-amino-4-deoxy-L-arabinose transferase-like glycosyltransferase
VASQFRHPGFRLVLVVILAFLVLGGIEAWRDSATYDEPVYVSSGVIAVLHHDLADNAEHPPLFKVLAALPVLAVQPVVPGDGRWNANNERTYSARFVDAQLKAGKIRAVTFSSRIVPLLETVAVAVALYALAAFLFGAWSGVVAALLWLCNPLVLGIGHLDGVDVPFALTTVLVSLAAVRWLQRRDRRSLVWLGLASGAAASAQTTGLLLGAVALGIVLFAGWRGGSRRWELWRPVVLVCAVAWVCIWVPYLVLNPSVCIHSWLVLPQPYIEGLRFLASNDTGGSPGFLLGWSWSGANVLFWPATLLVKLPIATLVVLIAGTLVWVALARSGRISRAVCWQSAVAVALPALVLFVFELPNPKTLGARYLLPSIALWMVVAAPIALVVGKRLMGASLGVVLSLAVAVTAASFPNSIATSTAPFVPAYRVATDSNVDWGQNFGLLTAWSRSRHPFVAYFGPRGITWANVPGAKNLITTPPSDIEGWVAASASDLTSADRDALGWLRGYCPVGNLGGSILLYRFTSPPTSTPGPATPAAACSGTVSRRVAR